jgi:hypothetical protein
MKTRLIPTSGLVGVLLALPTLVWAQFSATTKGLNYVSDGVKVIMTRYTGSSDNVTIPDIIVGLPVIGIEQDAFLNQFP